MTSSVDSPPAVPPPDGAPESTTTDTITGAANSPERMSSTPPEGGAISVIRPPASVEQAVTLPATSPPPSVAPPAFQTTIHAASEVPPDITVAHSLRPQAMADHIRYEVEGELGEGGIGKVLVARDTHLGRQVALKELLSDVRESMSPTEKTPVELRFVNEARITGQLEHPGIVPVYELGRRPDDTFYYTMRLVRGHTLELALAEADLEGRLALLKHVIDLCNTMAYAHSRGVIHRDLKPENVMLGDFGETVVLDWGLAKVRGETDIQHNALADELRR
ncbi:MAG: protein kinase, partial [Myxococcota bacterium]